MPKLSVIIPVYNVEPYLAKCLESVLESDGDYEVIVINDGSTDGSLAVAEQIQARRKEKVRLVTTENRGLGAARNLGMELAKGEYFYFLDSDDYLAPGGMAGLLACLEGDHDLIVFDSITVDEKGRELKYVPGCAKRGELTLAEYPGLLLEIPNVWNKIFRRTLFAETGILYPPRAWFEDLRTVPKLYLHAGRILSLDRAWHRYLLRPGSITNSAKAPRNREMLEAIDDLTGYYEAQGMAEKYRDELCYLAFYHEFLTCSVRVNLADRRSPIQEELLQDFLRRWPDYRANPYVRACSKKHKLIAWLLRHRLRLSVHAIMKLNERVKRG